MITIRKLVAVDMAWLGARVIVAEYALGIVLPLALGLLSLRPVLSGVLRLDSQTVLGVWLVGVGVNYIPLFLYAVVIARAGTAKEEGQPELARARRYGVQQAIILVPFSVAVIAALQERRQRQPKM